MPEVVKVPKICVLGRGGSAPAGFWAEKSVSTRLEIRSSNSFRDSEKLLCQNSKLPSYVSVGGTHNISQKLYPLLKYP